ncbi:chemotaxis protein [Vibrio breoganii]|uniref:Chemotaxis protein n=1 Tax=Vibrio breoganii TaxID=553239 RepID=A0AAP8SVT5_9VIBR|nr:chemotaxis protein [Vibrio breoganii]OED83513.1 chemotaxis protein [Vibrio breoganii ZF-55]OED97345.1 chemotaxis protein [Vibrio breoganii ZF-29]OEF81635.1 chemotaxis protein [Vibrio breoganii 1C10]OCH77757.1 chemotaxis protein [Vibrio breoganii]
MNKSLDEAHPVVLEAKNLTIDFRKKGGSFFGPKQYLRALNGLDFKLREGRCLAVVGESGCGKSTSAKIATKIHNATEGGIYFHGQNIDEITDAEQLDAYRRDVQMVFQDPFSSLNPLHTIRYHLTRPLKIYHDLQPGQEMEERLVSILEQVGLTPAKEVLDKFPHQLSGGQRQRVFLAKTLAIGAKVILADEPTSMLDVSIRIGVLNLMNKMKHEMGKAFMYITHDIATARYFAEDTVVLYCGHMVEWGSTEDITQNPQHPYTQLLLAAVPDPSRSIHEKLPTHRSMETPMWSPEKKGCPYAARCPQAKAECSEYLPDAVEVAPGHFTRCHLFV